MSNTAKVVNIFDGAVLLSLNEIREHTEFNDHLEAYILGAELLWEHELKYEFEKFRTERDVRGYMTTAQSNLVYEKYCELKAAAKAKLSEDVYNEFYMSF